MKLALLVVGPVFFAACGPGTATIDSSMAAESETASTAGELVSSHVDIWFPMDEGNTWTLESPSGVVRTVTYSDVYDGIGNLSGLAFDDQWMGTTPSARNSLFVWDEAITNWSPFIRFGYAFTSWSFGTGACSESKAKRAATGISVTTPAGTFTGARTISFERKPSPTARCAAPAFSELTFAPHVGLISINTYGEKFFLTSANVKGKAIPTASGIKGSLRLDQSTYVNTPNGIYCITTPCPGNEVTAVAKATYTVTNITHQTLTRQFTSGCQFDISLIDDAGAPVRVLSETLFCTLSLTHFSLAPGQSKIFTADLPLANRDGQQLFGNFTAQATLRNSTSTLNAAAVASFVARKP